MNSFSEDLLVSDDEDLRNQLSDVSNDEESEPEEEERLSQPSREQEATTSDSQSSSSMSFLQDSVEDKKFKRVDPAPALEYVTSNKGKRMLLHSGFLFYLQFSREERDRTGLVKHIHNSYYCINSKKGCQMQVRVKDGHYDKELREGHNHLADPVEAKKKIVEQRAKQAVCDNPHKSCRIAMNEAMRGMEEPVIAAINSTALRKSLEFRKRKLHRYPRGKTDAANLEIPDEWKSYDNGDPFVIYDSGRDSPSRFIILSSLFMLEKLVNVKTFAMDGTFKTRPRKWEQIFAIHVLVNGRFVPAVAVIMSKRGRSSYLYVLQRLTTYMEETFQVVWRPELVLTDFEVAQRSAIHQHFPGARHKCCFFHYAQAIQKWVQKVKLDQKYQSDVLFNEYIGLFRSLAFVPEQFLYRAYMALVDFNNDSMARFGQEVDYPGMARFLAYFKATWVCREMANGQLSAPRFCANLWNHNREALTGDPTSTCALESWHRTINSATKERGHSMWKCLNLFKTEIGTISRNQWIQISSLSTPDRSETRMERQKLASLQQAIRSFNGTDFLGGLKTITRTLRNVEGEAVQRPRVAALVQSGIGNGGTPRTTRQRRSRN